MDRLFVHRRGEHSGHREINGKSVRQRTLFSVYGHHSLNKYNSAGRAECSARPAGENQCKNLSVTKKAGATACVRPPDGIGWTAGCGGFAAVWASLRWWWQQPSSSAACIISRSSTGQSTASTPPSSSCWIPPLRPPAARSTMPPASPLPPPAWCGLSGQTPVTAASFIPARPTMTTP